MLIVAALTAVGVALRLAVAHQSLFADELSTRYLIAGRGLDDVVSIVHTDAEITPPLYFVASWLTTRIDFSPELLRAPSLIAGALTIPLVYLLGLRTVGHRAALVAAALTTFSPFMIYYSAEARGYGLMMVLVLGSTLCLLNAVEDGRSRWWWAAYAACTCAAVYTHYTSVFALSGSSHGSCGRTRPRAGRRSSATADRGRRLPAVALGPQGGPGLADDRHPVGAVSRSIFGYVKSSLVHWAIGVPLPPARAPPCAGCPACRRSSRSRSRSPSGSQGSPPRRCAGACGALTARWCS